MQPLPNRKTSRAQRYDYTSAGVYFITICCKNHEEYFGKIVDEEMRLNEIGRVCDDELHIMLQKRPSVDLHEYIIMPNHVHLLLCVNEYHTPLNEYHTHRRDDGLPRPNAQHTTYCPNAQHTTYRSNAQNTIKHIPSSNIEIGGYSDRASPVPTTNITNQTLGTIIGGRKSAVSKKCNELGYPFVRQSRYHDHIIRDENKYDNIKRNISKTHSCVPPKLRRTRHEVPGG